jgi:hypothetical protein
MNGWNGGGGGWGSRPCALALLGITAHAGTVDATAAFTYIMYPATGNAVGRQTGPSSYSGAMGDLASGRTQVLAAMVPLSAATTTASFRPSTPFVTADISVLALRKAAPPDPWRWTAPFSGDVWGAFVACMVFTTVLVLALDTWSPFGFSKNGATPKDKASAEPGGPGSGEGWGKQGHCATWSPPSTPVALPWQCRRR